MQNVIETDRYLSFEMMKGYSELKYQMFHQIWFLSFDFFAIIIDRRSIND